MEFPKVDQFDAGSEKIWRCSKLLHALSTLEMKSATEDTLPLHIGQM